jgi:single-strand DNA-binding protein
MSINKVILVGNVGKDPVVRYFDKGVVKATFPLATSETYNNQQGETITSTEWHNIVLWRALAEVAEKSVRKGSLVYIVGKIKTRSYIDKDGNNKYITEILADTLMLLEKKQAQGSYPSGTEGQKNETSDKRGTGIEVNEHYSQYPSPADGSEREWPAGKGSGKPGDEVPPDGQPGSDDDLPF